MQSEEEVETVPIILRQSEAIRGNQRQLACNQEEVETVPIVLRQSEAIRGN